METIRLEELPQLIQEPINLAHLVAHNDPFNPNDKTILIVPVGASCYSVLRDFEYDIEFYDLVIAKNQDIIDTDFIIEEADIISFSLVPKGGGGGSKQILSIIAMIALTVAAPYAVGAMMGVSGTALTAGMGMTIGGLSGALIVGANIGIMVLGSMLISSLFKPNVPSAPSLQSFEQSTTYGWNVQGNSLAQGGSVPILYGTMRITPQYIGKYLQTQNDAQILKGLLAVGEGPIDSISFIQINDQDAANYTDVVLETRLGTNDQAIITDFNDTWSDQGVGKKLTDTETWQYATTSGDAVTSFTVGISLPQGLFYANDSGGLNDYTVYIDIEYKAHSSSTWLSYQGVETLHDTIYYYVDQNPVEQSNYTIYNYGLPYADTVGPFDVYKKSIPWKGGPSTLVEYVETVTTKPTSATGKIAYPPGATWNTPNAQMAWTETKKELDIPYFSITAAQTSALRRAYTASGLAPDKYDVRVRFYQTPQTTSRYASTTYFEFLQEAVSDDFIYPNTALLGLSVKATDQLSGGMPKVTCVATRTTGTYGSLDNPAWACLDLLMNSRYGAGIPIERVDFQSFSDWADFCTTNNYKVNVYLDQTLDLAQSLQLVGQLGRGTVMQYGSTFKALVDKPSILPTQGFLFSMGNIIQNSFSETFLPLKDRANIIEVTYYDALNDYERATIEVSQGNYDLVGQANKTSINLLGCVDKEQALKQARYHLNQNRYLTITASWEASIDSIHCQVGDIVNVSHDVPQWGHSGRILGNTTSTITVDRDDLALTVGKTYYIQVSDASTDIQVYRQVTSIVGDVLTVAGGSLGDLGDYSVYSFGEVDRHAKKMRILSITTAGDMKRRITAIEYNENVYNDTVVVPEPILVSDWSTRNLKASEYLEYSQDGTIQTIVTLSWSGARLKYGIQYKKYSDTSYSLAGTAYGNTFSIQGLAEGQLYDFLVDGLYTQYRVLGKTLAPDPISGLIGGEFANTFTLNWEYLYKPLDFSHFIINANGVIIGTTITNSFSTYIPTTKAQSFTVQVVDTSGNTSSTIGITIVPQALGQIVGLKAYYVNEQTKIVWDAIIDPRTPLDYEIRMGKVWDDGLILGRVSIPEYTVMSNGVYMLKAHYQYPDGTDLYSNVEAQIEIAGAVLPKNIVATYDEKATGWIGSKANIFINSEGNLELLSEPFDDIPIVDLEPLLDYAGGIQAIGYYEVPEEHIVDIGTAQVCRLWVDYRAEGRIVTEHLDSVIDFDSWVSIDGRSSEYRLIPQVAIAQNDGIFGPWQDFVVGEYVGRKFKFRGIFISLNPDTTCILSHAIFYVDMPDKLQSGTGVTVGTSGTGIIYPIAFQAVPNVQVTIVNAQDGDDVILSAETTDGFTVIVMNSGVAVQRDINWLAKGY